jgi:putative DNA primase/helicase
MHNDSIIMPQPSEKQTSGRNKRDRVKNTEVAKIPLEQDDSPIEFKRGRAKDGKPGKALVCLENTKKVLKYLNISIHYNVITKREVMITDNFMLKGDVVDYKAIMINETAINLGYFIGKNSMIDHLETIARLDPINPIADYFDKAHVNWDGESRIEQMYNCLVSPMERKLGLAYFTKWCIQAVRLAYNSKGKMNQEFVLVLQGGQDVGKTHYFRSICPMQEEYFKDGLELRPDNKDIVLECNSYFMTELGELDATMKQDQAKLKAYITKKIDELRRPFARKSERYPRQTALCGTVNEDEFLKDKTGNRRYAVIPVSRIDDTTHIDLEQFWGEIVSLAKSGHPHRLNEAEKEMQKVDNAQFELINESEIIVEEAFHWGANKGLWKEMTTSEIAIKLNLNSNSRTLGSALKNKGCEKLGKVNGVRNRGWLVPPMKFPYCT